MKKLFRSLIAVAAAAAAMTSCAKEMQENFSNTQQINVNFVAQDADTKTEFGTPEDGKVPVIWKEGDKVGLNVNLNGDMKVYAVDAVPTDGGKKAQFKYEGTLPAALTAPYTFYVISPNSGYVSSSTKNGYFQFLVPSKQTPTETSVDPAAQLLFAVSNNYEGIPTDVVNLQFEHLVAYGNLSVKNLDTEGKKVTGIDLIFETNVIGRYYIYPAKTGDERIVEVAGDKVVSLVTERLENNIFSVMPGDVSGKALTVIVKVEGGAYKKQITIPADKAFKAGVISKFGVDLTGAEYEKEKTYSLVTDVATLKAGDQVIIGSSASLDTYGFVAMSTTQQQYNIAAVNVDDILKEKKLIAPGANIDVFTLEEGSAAGHFYMKSTNGKYLLRNPDSDRAGNKNDLIARLKTDADYDDGCANWAFTLVSADTGELTIIANTTISSRKYIKANPNSGTLIFSCYSKGSSMVAPCLYKLEDTPEPPKVLTIERLWGKYPGEWPQLISYNANEDRCVAMDEDYVYVAKAAASTAGIKAISITDPTSIKDVNVTGIEGGHFPTSCVRTVYSTTKKKHILLASSMAMSEGQTLKIYAWENGISEAPKVLLNWALGKDRRFGDFFTVFGTYEDAEIYFRNFTGTTEAKCNLTARFELKDGALKAQWPDAFTNGYGGSKGMGSIYLYQKGGKKWYLVTDAIGMFFPAGEQAGEEWGNGDDYSVWAKLFGVEPFEFNGKKYIAYHKMHNLARGWLTITKDVNGTDEGFKDSLIKGKEAENIVFQGAVQINSDTPSTEVVSGATSSANTMGNCDVVVKEDAAYLVSHQQNTGIAVFKMYMK